MNCKETKKEMETIKEKERKREQKKQLVPVQYTVSTKDGRMMIDAKGWSRFKSKSYLAVGYDLKIELFRQGELVQINFEILQ